MGKPLRRPIVILGKSNKYKLKMHQKKHLSDHCVYLILGLHWKPDDVLSLPSQKIKSIIRQHTASKVS